MTTKKKSPDYFSRAPLSGRNRKATAVLLARSTNRRPNLIPKPCAQNKLYGGGQLPPGFEHLEELRSAQPYTTPSLSIRTVQVVRGLPSSSLPTSPQQFAELQVCFDCTSANGPHRTPCPQHWAVFLPITNDLFLQTTGKGCREW
jgi:hypothetical protein